MLECKQGNACKIVAIEPVDTDNNGNLNIIVTELTNTGYVTISNSTNGLEILA